MQGGRGGGRNPFSDFPDPFGAFGGFPGFGGGRSMMPSLFGGQDPFDDPFFTRPFGGGMFETSFFGSAGFPFPAMHPIGSTFPGMHPTGFIEQQPPPPEPRRQGPIIEELNSDDEKEEEADNNNKQKNANNRKHGRSSKQPYVQDPDEEHEERRRKQQHLQFMNNPSRVNEMQPHHQGHSFTFQSSTVTYGGANGAYYTSSSTKRTGSDGLTFEERKEADSTTGQASHKISRALHEKGHSLERKLNSDGRVDSRETLHNLNEDELGGFEEAWKGKAQKHLPGWTGNSGGHNNIGISGNGQNAGGWALPSTEQTGRVRPDPREMAVPSRAHQSGRTKGSVERSGDHLRGKGRD